MVFCSSVMGLGAVAGFRAAVAGVAAFAGAGRAGAEAGAAGFGCTGEVVAGVCAQATADRKNRNPRIASG